jgi:hypothetical protein
MYNIDFTVKYKQIEDELIEKVKQQEEKKYTNEDIYNVCEELYRYEFLCAFGFIKIEDVNDESIQLKMNEIWLLLKENIQFMELFHVYKENGPFGVLPMEDDDLFSSMFNYDLFHILHKCICQIIKQQTIDEPLFSECKNHIIQILK